MGEADADNEDPSVIARRIVHELRSMRDESSIAGQRRFGIKSELEQVGASMPAMRAIAKPYRKNHALALELWRQPVHEARMVAIFVENPKSVTASQMDAWACDFDNWALVDGCCCHLFDRTPHALRKAHRWSQRRAEFVKRAGFVLMAGMAVHRKELPDDVFLELLPIIEREAGDDRNFVRKAVNWALRQIDKRNAALRVAAIEMAEGILAQDTPSARWIARGALRELRP